MSPDPTPLTEAPTQEPTLGQVPASINGAGTAVPEAEAPVPPTSGEEPTDEAEQLEETEALTLPEGWEEHETVVERLKAADTEGYNRAKSHLTKAHRNTLAELESVQQEEIARANERAVASNLVQTFAETLGNLDMGDPDTSREARKLLQANESWARIFLGSQEREAQASLVSLITGDERWTKDLTEEVADEFNAGVSELGLKLRGRLARAQGREEVRKAYVDAFSTWLEARDELRDKQIIKAALATESKRLEETAKKAAGLHDKAVKRGEGQPPAKPTGGAGGSRRSEAEILADPTTPLDQIDKILKARGVSTGR